MKTLSHTLSALLVSIAAASHAQPVYRCGNSYSQQPCPGGSAVATEDSRTPAQQKAATEGARHERRVADTLEKQRLRDEAAAARAAQEADKTQRAADKAADRKAAAGKPKHERARDRLPAYNAPLAPKQK